MALANELGEGGRQHFHAISAMSAKYDAADTDKKFSHLLKSGRGDVKIATLFYLAKQAGCEIKSKRTEHIERVATLRAVAVGKPGGYQSKDEAKEAAKRVLIEQDGMQGSDIDEVLDKVFAMPESELQVERKDMVSDLKEFLRQYDLRYNEITGKVEVSGVPINDRMINSIWVKAMETFAGNKKGVSKEVLIAIIESDHVPQYNPIRQFFLDNANLKPEGQIEALIMSLKVPDMQSGEGAKTWSGPVYVNAFLRKWLLSCVASWHGTYSVMMAVLTGAQAAGKTNFFRRLLPDELKQYYADNKLDKGDKDDLLLMATKAIICDDEFSGKSKQDYKMLKEIISKQNITLRRPFGRFAEDFQRIAVLCGCSNEPEIINDPTGNRRIIPIPLIEIDWDKYNAVDKTALWMELYHEWRQIGDGWMLTKDEVKLLNELTTKAHQVATEEEAIWMFFQHPKDGGLTEWLTNTEIRNYIETNSRLHISSQKLGIFLAKHDFERKGVRSGNATRYVYGVVKKRVYSVGDDL
jgi:Predicted P-loop ATPase and inactivated derivatives